MDEIEIVLGDILFKFHSYLNSVQPIAFIGILRKKMKICLSKLYI